MRFAFSQCKNILALVRNSAFKSSSMIVVEARSSIALSLSRSDFRHHRRHFRPASNGVYNETVARWSTAAAIFFSLRLSLGGGSFLTASRRGEGREGRLLEGPKKRITLATLLVRTPSRMLSLCARPGLDIVSRPTSLPLRDLRADGANRRVRWNTNSGSQIYRFLISQARALQSAAARALERSNRNATVRPFAGSSVLHSPVSADFS